MDKKIAAAIKLLESQSYNVKQKVLTTKKTFEVANDQLERFDKVVALRNIKVKVAVAEMIEDWLSKWEK